MQVNKLIQYSILTLIFVCVFLLNHLTPMTLDDCGYALNVKSFSDILHRQYHDYFVINGRVISQSIVQLFCGLTGKKVFNIFNALMYALLVLLIVTHIKPRTSSPNVIIAFLYSFFLCWFILPDQYITTLIIAGSLNYLWASVITLGYILLFWNFIVPTNIPSRLYLSLIFIISFISGAFVEMYAVCILPGLVIWLAVNKIKLNKSIISSLLGLSAGVLFVVLAPGNFNRINQGTQSIQHKILAFISNFLNETFIVFLTILIIALILYGGLVRRRLCEFVKENIFYFSAILFSLMFIFISCAGWSRTFFAVYIFSFILVLKFLKSLNIPKFINFTVIFLIIVWFGYDFYNEFNALRNNKNNYDSLVNQLNNKDTDVIFNVPRRVMTRKNNTVILSLSGNSWMNTSFSAFHDHKPIAYMSKELYDSLFIKPVLIQNRYEECPGCFTYVGLPYYIVPLLDCIPFKTISLSYSDHNELHVPKRQVKRILHFLYLDKFLYTSSLFEKNHLSSKLLYKVLYSDAILNSENYATLDTGHGRFLIVEKNNSVTKYGGNSMKLRKINLN